MQNIIGRPKKFDTDEIISIAMNYFWVHGYDNSSLDDLLKAMGIKKSSFYRTFKSKEELFSLTLDLYTKEAFQRITELNDEKGTKCALMSLVSVTIKNLESNDKVKGCLLVNSGKECFCKYDNLSSKISLQLVTFIDFFTNIIEKSKREKKILNPLDAKAISSRFLSAYHGLVIMIQAGADKEVIEHVFTSIEELLD
ncbi:TetR/AcrR family transcriptional regulator [Sulfurimonas sp.]|uniref:TetR/AcrR family transcriptional regulator n=1 Tax=Sulfurimonas sp. TaxID=2022749 RepID=UPI0025DC83AE|nr:TetR/AcrR family transcriptional regulator [Sulfurimonas sp.]